MSQQINLFGAQFRKQVVLLSANAMAWGAGAVLLLMLAAYGWVRLSADGLALQNVAATKMQVAEKEKLDRLVRERDPATQVRLLDNEITRVEGSLAEKREVLALLQSGELGDTRGYSDYLRAFARQIVDGLWITGFDIAAAGQRISLEGGTLRADLVPQYIKRLKGEPAMRGRQFAMLTLRPAKTREGQGGAGEAGKTADGQTQPAGKEGTAKVAATPGFLSFALSSDQEKPKEGGVTAPQSGSRAERYEEYAKVAQEAQKGSQ